MPPNREISVCRAGELTSADRAVWADIQREAYAHGAPQLANPFLSAEFALATARCRPRTRIAVIREDGEPVAFFPYQRGRLGVGRAVAFGVSDCQGPVYRPGFQWETRELLRRCRLALWEFDHLAEDHKPFEASVTGSFPSPVIDVAEGYDHYLGQLKARSPKFVRNTLAKERRLSRNVGEVRYVHDERDPAVLRTLMTWKSAQYRRTGRSDRFARSWIVRLVEQLFHTRSEACTGLLSVLYAGDQPVAAHFGLRSAQVLTWWFPAYNQEFAKYSPGLLLLLRLAEGAAADGLDYIDLGRGEKRYKDSLKTRHTVVREGWVTRPHPVAVSHRACHAPVRALRNTVQARPELFGPADRLLKRMGSVRSGGDKQR